MPFPDRLTPTFKAEPQAAGVDNDDPVPRLSRSPHPYHRYHHELAEENDHNGRAEKPSAYVEHSYNSSSAESGTEADDERGPLLKSLPAPPLKGRKGLRGATPADLTPAISPLPTPSHSLNDRRNPFFSARRSTGKLAQEAKEQKHLHEKYIRRRQGEIARRCTEFFLFCFTSWAVCSHTHRSNLFRRYLTELTSFVIVVCVLYCVYPFRLSWQTYQRGASPARAISKGFHLPSRFDPGPLIYPVFLPALISISIIEQGSGTLTACMVLGVSAVPPQIAFGFAGPEQWNCFHWLVSLLPLSLLEGHMQGELGGPRALQYLRLSPMLDEDMVWLFPLHHCLTLVLAGLTSTSLDVTELRLLSTGLINVLLFAKSPQLQILKALMWVGGISIYVCCGTLLRWELALARIPKFRFAKKAKAARTPIGILESKIYSLFEFSHSNPNNPNSDDDYTIRAIPRKRKSSSTLQSNGVLHTVKDRSTTSAALHTVSKPAAGSQSLPKSSNRSNTVSNNDTNGNGAITPVSTALNQPTTPRQAPFLYLTFQQAQSRKWLFAILVYVMVVGIVLIPIRHYISRHALSSHDPFGWALGYLLGNLSEFRIWTVSNNLEGWIRLPQRQLGAISLLEVKDVETFRQRYVGPANMRLLMCGYCATLLAIGIAVVLRLSSVVEVDTRRKVFHGIMVAILLPTIFIDPCFIALALVLILAIFLLLDLFRASQLPPIAKPLMTFLAPYIDGRDYRGPVIVSPIFLLVGCAIPLWLSLAAMSRSGTDPWRGWDTQTRDLSMVSGVICVGMGDAAASLIGRRYGRHKWYWAGGKSLEGSLAFMVAVAIGLFVSVVWLSFGGWTSYRDSLLVVTVPKVLCAGLGASLLESTLTAANDNVVVPIGLWLLVRGLNI